MLCGGLKPAVLFWVLTWDFIHIGGVKIPAREQLGAAGHDVVRIALEIEKGGI